MRGRREARNDWAWARVAVTRRSALHARLDGGATTMQAKHVLGAALACAVLATGSARADPALDALLERYGHQPVIDYVLERTHGSITIALPDGRLKESWGRPAEHFVNADTLAQDLSAIGATAAEVDRALAEREAERAARTVMLAEEYYARPDPEALRPVEEPPAARAPRGDTEDEEASGQQESAAERRERIATHKRRCHETFYRCRTQWEESHRHTLEMCRGDYRPIVALNRLSGGSLTARDFYEGCLGDSREKSQRKVAACERSFRECMK